MESEEVSQSEETLRELAKAQKTLDEVQSKMNRFKSKKKESANPNITKAPYPDLSKYFSSLSYAYEAEEEEPDTFNNVNPIVEEQYLPQFQETKPSFKPTLQKQNNSLTINQKLQKEKSSSIAKIEEYYIERNQALEERLKELKALKEKILKDQKLLVRNNQELQEEIDRRRNVRVESERVRELQEQLEAMKSKISELDKSNANIASSKKEMEKQIREALKGQKNNLQADIQGNRPKSRSEGRCQWH